MFVNVPFKYDAEILKPRCRNLEPMAFGDWVEVNIAETTASDAPVAVRWIDADSLPYVDTPIVKETRWFEDSHYRRVFDSDDRNEKNGFTRDTIIEACANGRHLSWALPFGQDYDLVRVISGSLKPIDETPTRKIENSTREKAISDIELRASELLLIDEELWIKCEEPIYAVKQGTGLIVSIPTAYDLTQVAPDRRFRIDRMDDAIDHFKLDDRFIRERADVLVPDSVRFDDETPAILHSTREALSWYAKSLHKMPTDFIVAWGHLRDAHNAADQEASPEHMDALIERFQAYVETCPEPDSWYAEEMSKAINRWSLRPLQPDDHYDGAMGPA